MGCGAIEEDKITKNSIWIIIEIFLQITQWISIGLSCRSQISVIKNIKKF